MVNRRTHDGRISRRARSKQRAAGLSPAPQGAPPVVTYLDDGTAHAAPEGTTVAEATASATDRPGRLVVLEYPLPGREGIGELAEAWDLHPLLVEDLVNAHQRPKLERYDDVLFIVARSARYNDEAEDVAFSEFHLLVRQGAVAVLCQDGRWVDGTDSTGPETPDGTGPGHRTLWNDREVLGLGPEAVVYRILDAIVDGYPPVLRGIAIDKEQIERQVFSGDAAVAERIYRLSQEVIDVQQTVSSMTEVLDALRAGFVKYDIHEDLCSYLDDVADHLTRAGTLAADQREALAQILNVNATLVAQRQNEDMKKISGWAAILFAPTLVGAIYGMNFDDMPELHWAFGYPMALGMMFGVALLLYIFFRRSDWM
ncbi:magnesium and cobalt transport protein CorA [Corynebacterium kalidii]|uniref:Magnesium and cobalt transport protein CorA n=1 Tax=Corynebacterium kalidii TaxID=2931982 RepID=A0A9X2B038_9CORY|nr:magnesium and cobalt transport protein CorA [Corynebacterium kalidii]MCJ7859212.1 magnesium and cobalt transport protein CorA [Corynebacterium kalidii]